MLITDLSKDIALILPALILVEGIIGLIAWFALGSRGGRAARFAAWLGLVTLTLWCLQQRHSPFLLPLAY